MNLYHDNDIDWVSATFSHVCQLLSDLAAAKVIKDVQVYILTATVRPSLLLSINISQMAACMWLPLETSKYAQLL